MAEVLRQDLKQQEKQQTDAKAFISIVKKYTDMKELDATILREFIDHIEVSHADRKSRTREITGRMVWVSVALVADALMIQCG